MVNLCCSIFVWNYDSVYFAILIRKALQYSGNFAFSHCTYACRIA